MVKYSVGGGESQGRFSILTPKAMGVDQVVNSENIAHTEELP